MLWARFFGERVDERWDIRARIFTQESVSDIVNVVTVFFAETFAKFWAVISVTAKNHSVNARCTNFTNKLGKVWVIHRDVDDIDLICHSTQSLQLRAEVAAAAINIFGYDVATGVLPRFYEITPARSRVLKPL